MLPLWIIDLTQNDMRSDTLATLLSGVSEHQMSYWHYSHIAVQRMGLPDRVSDASSFRNVLDAIIKEGQECFRKIQRNGYSFSNFQVCIIGDVEESLTRSVFHVLPSLLNDRIGSVFGLHLDRGLEITGLLYVSSTLHQNPSLALRKEYALFLEEINVLSSVTLETNYNNLIVFQDVQYHAERYYSQLSPEEVTQLLFQYLITIYFCGNDTVKLFDSINNPRVHVYSVGAASIYYDSSQHKQEALCELVNKLVDSFKDEDNYDMDYAEAKAKKIFSDSVISAETVLQKVKAGCSSIEIDMNQIEDEKDPHPVFDLFKSSLYTAYYQDYIKFLPARLISYMESVAYYLRSKYGRKMKDNRDDMIDSVKNVMEQCAVKVLSDRDVSYPTISQIVSVFESMKERLTSKRKDLCLQSPDIIQIPKYLKDDYEHVRNGSDEFKPAAIIDRLVKTLKSEPVVIALAGRCFFLGIMLVFTFLPLLSVLSPGVINLGDVMEYKWIWIPVIFLTPFIVQFCFRLRRIYRRVKREKYRLLASVLYELNNELSASQLSYSGNVYDILEEECGKYIDALNELRNSLGHIRPDKTDMPVPETVFNQSLTEGKFVGKEMISDPEQLDAEIYVDRKAKSVTCLDNADTLRILKTVFSDTSNVRIDSAAEFNGMLKAALFDKMIITSYSDISDLLYRLNNAIDLAPLKRMAGLNGMLLTNSYNSEKVIRGTNDKVSPYFPGYIGVYNKCCREECTSPYLFLAHIHELDGLINSENVCNAKLDSIDTGLYHVLLTLYYSYYRKRSLAYRIAGIDIRVDKNDMSALEQQIKGGMS